MDHMNMSFSGKLHVTQLKSAGGCFVKGRMSCASIFSSYFSLADKITHYLEP